MTAPHTWRTFAKDGNTVTWPDEAACRQAAEAIAQKTDDWVGIEHFEEGQWWLVDSVGEGVKYADWRLPQDVVLGDYVRTDHYGHVGRVHKVHPGYPAGFGCPEDDDWLRGQAIPVMQYKNERWVSILVHNGGSVVCPSALVTRIDPFPFKNDYANQYFRAES